MIAVISQGAYETLTAAAVIALLVAVAAGVGFVAWLVAVEVQWQVRIRRWERGR